MAITMKVPVFKFLSFAFLSIGFTHVLVAQGTGSSHPAFTTFVVPGATQTRPVAINNSGLLAGWYIDATGTHGFLRNRDGEIQNIDGQNSYLTQPAAMDNAGAVAARYVDNLRVERVLVRAADGSVSFLSDVHSASLQYFITGMNSKVIVGYSQDVRKPVPFGFVLDRTTGVFSDFVIPNASIGTFIQGVNAAGTSVGYGQGFSGTFGFTRGRAGLITKLRLPTGSDYVLPMSIDDAGTITGNCGANLVPGLHGFIRSPSGVMTTFDVAGALNTYPVHINNHGTITGFYQITAFGAEYGFLRSPSGDIVTFQDPTDPAFNVIPANMNDLSDIVGYTGNNSLSIQGFAKTP